MAGKDEDKAIDGIDAGKATSVVRNYLEENYGNLGMLLFRVEGVEPNGEKNKFKVLCSLLSSLGSSKRLYYLVKVNIANGAIVDVFQGEEDEDGKITLKKRDLPE